MVIRLANQEVILRPAGTAIVRDGLIVADLHLGKERAFRQSGLPVPDGPTAQCLARLADEVAETAVTRLIFLGDLFHARDAIEGATFDALLGWLDSHPAVEPILVEGNHDNIPQTLRGVIPTAPSLDIGGLGLFHHPQGADLPHLAGHLHPAVRLGEGPDRLRLPCFWRHRQRLILPSFSSFTGCSVIDAAPGDEVYVAVAGKIRGILL